MTTSSEQTTTVIAKKEVYNLDEVSSFYDLIKYTNLQRLKAHVEKDGLWTWEEIENIVKWILEQTPVATTNLLILDEVYREGLGLYVSGQVCKEEDLTDPSEWRLWGGCHDTQEWLGAKVISIRGVSSPEHVVVAHLLYYIGGEILELYKHKEGGTPSPGVE